MHNGDYSGRRFSELTTVDSRNVASLSLGWTHRIAAAGPAGGGGTTAAVIKGTPVVANGVLYVTIPDHVWALDARSGRELWHATLAVEGRLAHRQPRRRRARHHASTSRRRTASCWRSTTAPARRSGGPRSAISISSTTPRPRRSSSRTTSSSASAATTSTSPATSSRTIPETGALQWRWYTHPEPGTPEAKTWPSVEAMLHGGGMTWGSTTYDPQLNLIYFGTGNPQPVINGRKRAGRQPLHRVDRRAEPRHRDSSPGTSSRRRTTRTTGTRRRRRCSSTARSTASRGSSWRRPRATAGSSSSIARPGATSRAPST